MQLGNLGSLMFAVMDGAAVWTQFVTLTEILQMCRRPFKSLTGPVSVFYLNHSLASVQSSTHY